MRKHWKLLVFFKFYYQNLILNIFKNIYGIGKSITNKLLIDIISKGSIHNRPEGHNNKKTSENTGKVQKSVY